MPAHVIQLIAALAGCLLFGWACWLVAGWKKRGPGFVAGFFGGPVIALLVDRTAPDLLIIRRDNQILATLPLADALTQLRDGRLLRTDEYLANPAANRWRLMSHLL